MFEFSFRQQIRKRGDAEPTTADMHDLINKDGVLSQLFPRLKCLFNLAVLIPCSTATVERGFSLMNSICTSSRSRLNQASLDALMRICKEGQDSFNNDDLEEMVDIFKNKKNRRIDL